MDHLLVVAQGHVGKIQGLSSLRGQEVYKFSLAVNFKLPESTLWLQCSVVAQDVLSLVTERGLIKGDHLLVQCDRAAINAMVDGNRARSWLNVEVHQIWFLTAPALPQIERAAGFEGRVIDYNQLMKVG